MPCPYLLARAPGLSRGAPWGAPRPLLRSPKNGSMERDAVSKKLPAAIPRYCSRRAQCLVCFQDDLGPARDSNISFCTFWEPNRWRHSKNSGFHDPHMTFTHSRPPPGPPKRFKNKPQTKQIQQVHASSTKFEANSVQIRSSL